VLLVLASCAAGLVAVALLSFTVLSWPGDPGWTLEPTPHAFVVGVASLTPNGPAARAGVRAGDRIDVRALAASDRILLVMVPVAGRPLHVALERGGRVLAVDVVPQGMSLRWDGWTGYLVLGWIAAFAALIAWRRPGMPEARLLSAALSCYVAADALQFVTTPSPALDLVFSALNTGGVLGGVTLALLVRFNARFGRPRGRARRIVDALAYAAAALLALFGIAGALALGTTIVNPVELYFGSWGIGIVSGAQLAVVLSGGFAIAGSRGWERQRVTWAVISIGTLLAASAIEIVVNAAVPTRDTQLATQAAVNVIAIAAPVGLTYSVFTRRLLDIGFALNRAAVFSGVSAVLIGGFMTVEWALGGWLANAGHVTSTTIGIALALGLGFSIRFVHGHVDRVIDRAFFRKRHQHEEALLRFASEAAFMTSADALLARAVREVAEHVETSHVAILTDDRGGMFVPACSVGSPAADVDANDPALVAMRAAPEPVDLHRRASGLRGEYAFPLMSCGVLVGTLVCGAKRTGDAYAPDERENVASVARSVGIALGMLAVNRGELETRLQNLQDQFAGLRAEVHLLVDLLCAQPAVKSDDPPA
jgi:hypothetical protein